MPVPKSRKKTAARPVRFVKSPQPERRAPKRAVAKRAVSKRAKARPASAPRKPRRASRTVDTENLPGWSDLSRGKASKGLRPEWDGLFAAVPTLRLALMIIATAAIVTLYVGHVYATTNLLTEVEQLRSDNLDLHLTHNQVKADFDRVSSPARIAQRARGLGLVEAVPTGTPINPELR